MDIVLVYVFIIVKQLCNGSLRYSVKSIYTADHIMQYIAQDFNSHYVRNDLNSQLKHSLNNIFFYINHIHLLFIFYKQKCIYY